MEVEVEVEVDLVVYLYVEEGASSTNRFLLMGTDPVNLTSMGNGGAITWSVAGATTEESEVYSPEVESASVWFLWRAASSVIVKFATANYNSVSTRFDLELFVAVRVCEPEFLCILGVVCLFAWFCFCFTAQANSV